MELEEVKKEEQALQSEPEGSRAFANAASECVLFHLNSWVCNPTFNGNHKPGITMIILGFAHLLNKLVLHEMAKSYHQGLWTLKLLISASKL